MNNGGLENSNSKCRVSVRFVHSCQIKTDHHYYVDVEVTGSDIQINTCRIQSTTTFPVVKDVMEADSENIL